MGISSMQSSFAGGEISPNLYGRVDLERYASSLRRCRNFIVRQFGGVDNRSGFRYLGAAKNAGQKCRLIPFQFSVTQTFALEFGANYMRVWSNGAPVIYSSGASAGQPVEVSTPYAESDLFMLKFTQSADVMTICHAAYPPMEIRRYGNEDWRTALVSTNNGPFQDVNIDEGITVRSSGETGTVTLTSTSAIFGAEQVGGLFFLEQLNTGQIAKWETDRSVALGEQIRYSTNYYECIRAGTTGTVAPTHTDGSALDGWYGDANSVEWLYIHSGNGIAKITGVGGDGLTATATVINRLPKDLQSTPSHKWAKFAWNNVDGYPSTVVYFQQRLIFAASTAFPQTIWTSKNGDYKDFGSSVPQVDDDAISYTYAGRQLNKILHMIDVGSLIALTSGGEYKINGDQTGVLTPSTFSFSSQGQNGASDVAPISVSNVALFVQQKGGAVRDLAYSFDVDGFQGSDLTILANHLFIGHQIVDWAFAITPFSIVWCVREDGVLLGLTYLRDQQVVAWHPHPATNGFYESVCSISEGSEDAVYAVVRRVINGQTRRYIERLSSRIFTDISDSFIVDSGLSYDGRNTDTARTVVLTGGTGVWDYKVDLTLTISGVGYFNSGHVNNQILLPYTQGDTDMVLKLTIASVTNSNVVIVRANRNIPSQFQGIATNTWSLAIGSFSGLNHLEGQTVSILSDGNVEPQKVVSNGAITLETPGSVVHVGLPINSTLETLDVNFAGQETILDKKKMFNKADIMVQDSRGIFASTPGGKMYEYPQREFEFYDDPVANKTGLITVDLAAEWDTNGRIIISQSDPLPLSILSIIPKVTLGG
ncbi:hypothetical protein LLS47_12300 [Rouxiella badensis]|uniref:hypothetical protein n=1 Tax=Rouxiella badensis TaxID=1646377 RepID=UPI001D149D0A|nr:hypothetical protein [Rouxiella badensis]MCC3733709.1 hypothetical protein [Rouxiella badensis]MCC3759638.1 hypothetical protein [Rouxiella badensis]